MTVNVPGASTWQPPKPLDKGWYRVRVDEAKQTKTQKGIDAMNLRMTVLDGPMQQDGSSPTDPSKNTLFDFQLLDLDPWRDEPKKYQFMQDNLMKMLTAFDVLEGDSFEIEDLVGKEVDVYLVQEDDGTGAGDKRNSVSKYKQAG